MVKVDVHRYNSTYVTYIRPPWNWSARFDDECIRHLKVRSPLPVGGRLLSLPRNTSHLFESNWAGGWYVSLVLSRIRKLVN